VRVLLVEDNPESVQLTRNRLAGPRSPWEVEHADTLQDALGRLRDHAADVVLLDLQLPDARGLEGVNRLSSAFPAVPLVVMTSHHDEAMGVVALQKGAQDYLVKTQIDRSGLDRSLRYAIERARAAMSEALYGSVFAWSRDPIVAADLEGRVTGWNPSASTAYGYSAEEMVGQPLTRIAGEGGTEVLDALLTRALLGEALEGVPAQHKHQDGTPLAVTLTVRPLKGAAGRPLGALVLVRVASPD
jgi:two-component system, cell cycle response regulator